MHPWPGKIEVWGKPFDAQGKPFDSQGEPFDSQGKRWRDGNACTTGDLRGILTRAYTGRDWQLEVWEPGDRLGVVAPESRLPRRK